MQFARGTVETNAFDDLIIYDGADNTAPVLFANPANTGNLGPAGSGILTTDPDFFAVDVYSTSGFLHMTFTSDPSVQCATSTVYDPWEWTVTCIDCVSPVATASQNLNCATGDFTVDVALTSLGNSATVDIVQAVNGGAATVVHNNVSLLQVYVMGPYLSTDVVDLSIVHASNSNCDVDLGSFSAGVDCIQCGAPAESSSYCYVASDNQSWTYFASGTGSLRLRFLRGTLETNAFDDLTIYDGPDNTFPILFANPANTGNLGPAGSGILTTDPDFFSVDVLATGQYLHMTLTSDPSVQCATSTVYDPWLWEVLCFDCTAPTATASIVPDCNNYQFSVAVDLTSLGDATDVDIVGSVNGGASTVLADNVSTLGMTTVGPFASASVVNLNVVHNQDALCNASLGNLTFTCPPTVLCGVYSNSTVASIPDASNIVSTIVTGPMMGERITDLDVVIKINHTDLADLDIRLTSPSGTVIDILNDQCASKDSMNVRFSDEAATTIVCGTVLTVPLVGEYRTSGTLADALSAFDTQLFEGTWTLSVTDDATTDLGSLIQWCLIPTLVTPDCPDVPTALAVTSNTFNSVTLNWTPGATNTGYAIEYGPVGFTPGTGTVVTGALPPPAVVGGLASGETFQFYLTETCLAGDAVAIGPVTGSTLLLVNSYPYCNDLEGYTLSGLTCATVNNLAPALGWTNANEGAAGTDWLTDENGTSSTITGPSLDYFPGVTGGNYLYIEASTCASRVAQLYSPAFDFTSLTNQPVVSFWYHMCGNDGAMGTLSLEMESPVGAGNWTTVFSRSGEDPDQTTEASAWKEVRVTLTNLPASTASFRITGTTLATGFEGDMAIDYFCVTEAPCFLPQASVSHTCTSLFTYSAEVTVTDLGPHTGVDISDGLGNNVLNAGLGTHVLGTYGNGTNISVSLTSVNDGTCVNSYNYSASCVVPTDDCTQAQLLECGVTVTGNTSGMANTLPTNACPFLGAPSLSGVNWWRFSTPIDQEVTLSTCNLASFNTRISVFEGPDCNNLTCANLNDDQSGCSANSSEMSFLALANEVYYVAIHGSGAASGVYTLAITCAAPCLPITLNDHCADAETLTLVLNDGFSIPTLGDNTCAFNDLNPTCNLVGNVQGVWYTFNSGVNSVAYLDLLDDYFGYSATNLSYVLYDGACTPLSASNEIDCATLAEGEDILLPALATNTDYRLLVYNAGGIGTEGTFGVQVTVPAQFDAGIDSVHYPNDLVCTSNIAPVVELRNYGAVALTSVDILFSFDGGATQTFSWTGNLAFNASELVELPPTLLAQGPHT
ncbi:MAG: proprotein convertase P-domain-containing protein [Flavobacteriales bacterium]|nr:proprotein convertase P-domain-containing protein [Flavobacteriales bacterium]